MSIVTFSAGDTEYIEKLNELSQQAGIVETAIEETTKLRGETEALKNEAQRLKEDAQAIAESGLPSQAGNRNKTLISNGVATSWQFPNSINRWESQNFTLEPGDYVFVKAPSQIIEASIPSLTGGEPFVVKNSATSTHAVRIVKPGLEVIASNKFIFPSGDNITVEPGEIFSFIIDPNNTTKAEAL